jgi:hypothetical protein
MEFNDSNATVDVGVGTASLVGGTMATFAAGFPDDLAIVDQAWNTATYAPQGTGDRTRGVRFLVPTTGYENIVVSFDQRFSNSAANLLAIQYTTDGVTFTGLPEQLLNAGGGDAWVSFNSGALGSAANNNANFGFQVLAAFNPTAYVAANTSGTAYATTGTRRFDLVTVNGDAVAPIPTPALLPALIGFGASIVRKRKQLETV